MSAFLQPDIYCLPILLFIGLCSTIEDMREGKIRNQWTLFGFFYALAVMGIFIFNGTIGADTTRAYFINLLISFILAYGFWMTDIFAAGDAKLFIACAALIPIHRYTKTYLIYFPSFALLVNVFVPATIYLLIRSIAVFTNPKTVKNTWRLCKKMRHKKPQAMKTSLKTFFGLFMIFLISQILRQKISIALCSVILDQNSAMIITFLIYRPLRSFFAKRTKLLILALIATSIYVYIEQITGAGNPLSSITTSIKMSMAIMLIHGSLELLIGMHIRQTSKKTTHFASWIFLGALISWFGLF